MALTITHAFISPKSDGTDNTLVRPSNWNAEHSITGTIDESMIALSDVTTGNVTIGHHGFVPKAPNDSSQFLDGTGVFSVPSGGGDVTSDGDNNFSGLNNFSGNTQFGTIPTCDNALITVYQTKDGDSNTSMFDIVATGGGFGNMTATVINSLAIDNLSTNTGLYVRVDNNGGITGNAYGIFIDTPGASGENHTNSAFGLYISDQINGQMGTQDAACNIYSQGAASVNLFDGFVLLGTTNPENAQLHVEYHADNAIGIFGEGYTSLTGGTSIGVKGTAAVGISTIANQLASLVAGSPETDDGAQVLDAIGLLIEDVNVGQNNNWAIKSGQGNVNLGDYLGIYTTGLPYPSDDVIISSSTSGSTTYNYAFTVIGGADQSTPVYFNIDNAPDTLDNDNYVSITIPEQPYTEQPYVFLYRITNSGTPLPTGLLTTIQAGTMYNDTGIIGSQGILPLNGELNQDTSEGLVIASNGRTIYSNQGNGFVIGCDSPDGYRVESRISFFGAVYDDEVPTVQFQMAPISDDAFGRNVLFSSGYRQNTQVMDRALFYSKSTTFSDNLGAPAPAAMVEIAPNTDVVPLIIRSCQSSQTENLTEWLAPNQAILAKVNANGTINAVSHLTDVNTVASSASPTFDCSLGDFQTFIATSNATFIITNAVRGQHLTFVIIIDGDGPYDLAWPGNVGGAMSLSAAPANKVFVQDFVVIDDSNNLYATDHGVSYDGFVP